MKNTILFAFVLLSFSSFAQFIQPPLPHNVYKNNDGSLIQEPEFAAAIGFMLGTFAYNEFTIHSADFDQMTTVEQNQTTLRNYGVGMSAMVISYYGIKYLRENKPIKKFMRKHHIRIFK